MSQGLHTFNAADPWLRFKVTTKLAVRKIQAQVNCPNWIIGNAKPQSLCSLPDQQNNLSYIGI